MHGRVAELVAIGALATVVTVAIAAPVLRATSDRVFGMPIVGRHHDPFTVMAQIGGPVSWGVYSQPVTDIPGRLLARASGPVAAYNWLVLLSFPFSAVAAYLLARHLSLSPAGATIAAMAYAFSPFHISQAAYHAHIAQTQWMPLYLLALWRCLDIASPVAMGLLGAAAVAVTLSNFYGGLIAAAITPVALAAYWFVLHRADTRSLRRLGITIGSLVVIAAAGVAYTWYAAGAVVENPAAYAFSRVDLSHYSARWWGYLVPPVAHPLLGASAQRIWADAGVQDGLLEQQVSLGWGIVALGVVAVVWWLSRDRQLPSLTRVPVLVTVAVTALVCSLSPASALLHSVAPMFRGYARFGLVVQLMAVLLAGIGFDRLRRAGTRPARILAVGLLALAAGEYAVSPSTLWRDVLPTQAHRWVAQQPALVRVLDCAPATQESDSVRWLTGYRVMLLDNVISDCTEPDLPGKLAASGYTHLIVRRATAAGRWFAQHAAPDGLRAAATFDDGQVFAVEAHAPVISTALMTGFFPREHGAEWTWRWMGADAAWRIVNAGAEPIVATLAVELSAFHRARRLELRLDGHLVQTLLVEPSRRTYEIGPLTVGPGDHELLFHPVEGPTVASEVTATNDRRPLSFALGTWRWILRGGRP